MAMKKNYAIQALVFLVVVALVFAAGCQQKPAADKAPAAGNTAQPQPVTLQLSHSQPPNGISGLSYEYLARTIEEESKGQLKVKVSPAGSLVSDAGALEAIQAGNVDIAHFQVANLTPTMKELTPFEIPGAYPGNKFTDFDKLTTPIVKKIFDKYGVKYLGPIGQDTMVYVSKKKVLKTPADFKGLKIRTAGKWAGEAVKLWGGAPVTVPIGDLPTALQRGTVDAAYTTWIATNTFKLYESAPYITFNNQQETFVGVMMNQKKWNSLTKDQQDAIDRAMEKFKVYSMKLIVDERDKFKKVLSDAKCTAYVLNDAENAAFNSKAAPLMEEVKKIAGSEGAELIDAFNKLK
ncbi:MAG: TRAP transporter substrate-binding protein [Peptococcaceae bacterium]|jgi:TRAP-type C4-dicarboxylate transport system substrate-binding protein|nr:TRAP transporter substrate-binding protein [Peptococcaceae bacterium]MDH7525763.1 TRAP transporter substrate-binding protein [Peptococcaceae bacterium]